MGLGPVHVTVERRFWMRWRVRAGYPVGVVYWLLATPRPHWIAVGGAIAVVGLLIRAAAAGYLRKTQELACTGPYARTRNPLYLGSAFIAAGFAVASCSWIAGGLIITYFAIFYYAVMRNEEGELRSRFGSAFESYAEHVPLFFPRWRPAPGENQSTASRFSWSLCRRNREYRALAGTAVALGLVWLRMWLAMWIPWLLQ
jgi:protein-S-isoprenylcysteine O-methyltransferase Ste14